MQGGFVADDGYVYAYGTDDRVYRRRFGFLTIWLPAEDFDIDSELEKAAESFIRQMTFTSLKSACALRKLVNG